MGECMWPGQWSLRYYLTSASTGNEDLGKRYLHGTGICSPQYWLFYMAVNRDCNP